MTPFAPRLIQSASPCPERCVVSPHRAACCVIKAKRGIDTSLSPWTRVCAPARGYQITILIHDRKTSPASLPRLLTVLGAAHLAAPRRTSRYLAEPRSWIAKAAIISPDMRAAIPLLQRIGEDRGEFDIDSFAGDFECNARTGPVFYVFFFGGRARSEQRRGGF